MSSIIDETLAVHPGLPIARANFFSRAFLTLQLGGILQTAGLSGAEVRLDPVRVLGAFSKKEILKVGLFYQGIPSAGLSRSSWADALHRACGELVETVAWRSQDRASDETRNGWAAGPDELLSKESAYRELIERDSLITHFLCPSVKSTVLSLPQDAILQAKIVQLWSGDPNIKVVLCGMNDPESKRWYLGAASGSDILQASQKAYLEMAMILCGYRFATPEMAKLGSRQRELLLHISESATSNVSTNLDIIFSARGNTIPEFTCNREQAAYKINSKYSKFATVASCIHPRLCSLSWGQRWKASREFIEEELRVRNLKPQWMIHPFA